MTRTRTHRRIGFSALIAALLVGSGFAVVQAQDDENQPILDYRQRVMGSIRGSMANIGDMLKYKMPYSSQHFQTHAKNISDYAKLLPDAFEKKIAEGRTDAKPAIWNNWDDFVSKANALSDAAAALATAAEGGDARAMMPQVSELGNACRNCHNEYRKPEEERFPRN